MFFAAGQLQAALSAVGAPPSLALGRFGLAGNVAGYVLELFEQLREAVHSIADLILKGNTLLEILNSLISLPPNWTLRILAAELATDMIYIDGVCLGLVDAGILARQSLPTK